MSSKIIGKDVVGTKCIKGCKLEVCKSACGYYIGTVDEEFGYPNCRITGYFKTKKDALTSELLTRVAVENNFCNGNKGCLKYPLLVLRR